MTPAFDVRVGLFGLIAALVVGVVFGMIPAWQATGTSLASVMASESRSATSTGGRLRSLLVSGEVAAAVVLLCGAGLLLQTVLTLVSGDTGYRATSESVLTLDFSVRTGKNSRYPTAEAVTQFYDAVGRDVSALPEVRRVGWASSLPYGTSELGRWTFEIVGDPPVEARDRPTAEYTTADPGYFKTLDLPIVSGRGFNERDTLRSVPVCLVNEAFVRRHFKGRNPIGGRLSLTRPPNEPTQIREIVGVARQTSGEPDAPEELLQVYVPSAQFPTGDVYMVVQPSVGAAETLTPLVRRVVARIDPDVPVRRDRTIERLSIESTAGYRFRAKMVGTFAVLALVLAMVGVFGVLAYTVQQRQREIGVRMALGATTARVMWLVFRDAGSMIATGAVVGVVLAGLSGRLIATFLFSRGSAGSADILQRARRDPAHRGSLPPPHRPGAPAASTRSRRFARSRETVDREEIAQACLDQAGWAAKLGSPMYNALLRRMAEDVRGPCLAEVWRKLRAIHAGIGPTCKLVVLNPNASARLPLRRLPLESFTELARNLLEDPHRILLQPVIGPLNQRQSPCNDNLCLKSISIEEITRLVRSRLEAVRSSAAPVGGAG